MRSWRTHAEAFGAHMGNTPSLKDAFAPRAAPGPMGLASAQDRFRKPTPPPVDHFKPGAVPARDAFAARPASPKTPKLSPVGKAFPPAAEPTRSPRGFHNPFSPKVAAPADDELVLTEPLAAPVVAQPTRAPLQVVASAPHRAEKPAVVNSRQAAKSSSLVLVSGAAMTAAATETLEAPPPTTHRPTAPPPRTTAPVMPVVRRTGGGSGGGMDGGGPTGSAAKPRRGFNQDDLFGAIFGLAVIAFLLLWLMRGRSEESQGADQIVSPQSSPNTFAALPPAPAAPLVDPFGNAPVDLTPKGPIPAPLPDPPLASTPQAVAPAAAPTPQPAPPPVAAQPLPPTATATPPLAATPAPSAAPAAPQADSRMHAWFCTASSRLTKASRTSIEAELDRFTAVFAGKELVIRGYADTRGASAYNSLLAGERANTVADFLRTRGLAIAEVSGVGELAGLDDNQNCPNQRRVDIWVKGAAAEPSRACAPEPDVASLVCG